MNLCFIDSAHFCTFLWSITPFLEMRASVPLGLTTFGLSAIETVLISTLGGIITAAIVLKLLPYIVHFLEKHIPIFHKLVQKIFTKTRSKHSKKMGKLGSLFLVLFVAIPIPGSGAWSGVLIAYLFGIPYWRAIILVGIGILSSATIMAILTLSAKGILNTIQAIIQ